MSRKTATAREAGKVANRRLANVVIWNLEDITGLCVVAQDDAMHALARAEAKMDPVLTARIARLVSAIARIDAKARAARNGEYLDLECETRRGNGGLG